MFNLFFLKGGLSVVDGFFCDGVSVGLKPNSELDVAYIRSDSLCEVEALFTTNNFQAAPIKHFLNYSKNFKSDFLLINSKNANALTGKKGVEDIEKIFQSLSKKLKVTNPIMSSTGVIGYRLDCDKIISSFDKFNFKAKNSNNAAKAIMTTDTYEKECAIKVELDDGSFFHVAAIAKGAGMINPAMATMLCFVLTDANIPKEDMRELLLEANEDSFNAISVDGDTSTNDTVLLLSNAKSKVYNKTAFKMALKQLLKHLAFEILKDGEGASKVVAFEIKNAKNIDEAKKASKALSNSLLVKTALFGEDPNWGRIASTIGASGVACDEESLIIKYDDLLIYSKEFPMLDKTREKEAIKIMQKDSFKISCDLGVGKSCYTSYGCDLSYEYIKINADYRT